MGGFQAPMAFFYFCLFTSRRKEIKGLWLKKSIAFFIIRTVVKEF